MTSHTRKTYKFMKNKTCKTIINMVWAAFLDTWDQGVRSFCSHVLPPAGCLPRECVLLRPVLGRIATAWFGSVSRKSVLVHASSGSHQLTQMTTRSTFGVVKHPKTLAHSVLVCGATSGSEEVSLCCLSYLSQASSTLRFWSQSKAIDVFMACLHIHRVDLSEISVMAISLVRWLFVPI